MQMRSLERQRALALKREEERRIAQEKRDAKAEKLRKTFEQNEMLMEQQRQMLLKKQREADQKLAEFQIERTRQREQRRIESEQKAAAIRQVLAQSA